jgi:DNA polymerase III subunit epsilon
MPKLPVEEFILGSEWDLPLQATPFVFVDLEMTGLNPAVDRVIEICIERVVGGVLVERLDTLISPFQPPPSESSAASEAEVIGNEAIHHITAESLQGAPSFAEVLPAIRALLAGAVFVAHGARHDVTFLQAEALRVGAPLGQIPYLDTLNLSRRSLALKSHALTSLSAHFGIDQGVAHRAAADVLALRGVFDRVTVLLAPTSARDLWDVRVGERKAREAILDQCEQARASGMPIELQFRSPRKAASQFVFQVTEVRRDLESPTVVGYEVTSRSRRELRADRILRVGPTPV